MPRKMNQLEIDEKIEQEKIISFFMGFTFGSMLTVLIVAIILKVMLR